MTRKSKLKSRLRHIYHQVGKTHIGIDRLIKAKKVGWRKSASGHWYFENRRNRSDKNLRLRL
jgi:hypothetical protein